MARLRALVKLLAVVATVLPLGWVLAVVWALPVADGWVLLAIVVLVVLWPLEPGSARSGCPPARHEFDRPRQVEASGAWTGYCSSARGATSSSTGTGAPGADGRG